MEATTTLRVHKTTQIRLKQLSAAKQVTITDLVDRLVDEHASTFWKGFNEEAKKCLNKGESKSRKTFEGALGDCIDR
jgi:hypothetical protein